MEDLNKFRDWSFVFCSKSIKEVHKASMLHTSSNYKGLTPAFAQIFHILIFLVCTTSLVMSYPNFNGISYEIYSNTLINTNVGVVICEAFSSVPAKAVWCAFRAALAWISTIAWLATVCMTSSWQRCQSDLSVMCACRTPFIAQCINALLNKVYACDLISVQ